jgi:hypothetical protein
MRLTLILAMLVLGAASCGGQTTEGTPGSENTATATTSAIAVVSAITADACMIQASNYDQSCAVDSDCVMVTSGDYCDAGTPTAHECFCGGSAINVDAQPQFSADVAKTPIGSGAVQIPGPCGCPPQLRTCCQAGKCSTCPS